jgi:DNA polymerase-3 subunit gamma/tau
MSYQVLARKWRPRRFSELSGQEHVVRALTNALERKRLHHAYLLTGTRGVGKTTIARILAKSLNCETGVTAEPCGVCAACTDIDAGRFVDLLELDAASNTGIDNMREILDNARYAPTAGRYKVYLIDEVHMLSKAAFNSMLKTLEEPPEHVKFVLATTDPQKIPVTVLSRCLQFNLKQLPAPLIVDRLAAILEAETIAAERPALVLIARAAQGSMRDALSLLDQAIAYGGGEVRAEVVATMLGAVDVEHVFRIADAVLARDGAALLAEADALAARNLSAAGALEELASLYHRIATAQVVPGAVEALDDGERIAGYAARMAPEDVQLAYQICVQGRADLPLAPDEAMGFSMTLLRLLAFEPAASEPASDAGSGPGPATLAAASGQRRSSPVAERAAPTTERAASATAGERPMTAVTAQAQGGQRVAAAATMAERVAPAPGAEPADTPQPLPADTRDWVALMGALKLPGMAGQLAAQSEWRATRDNEIVLALPEAQRHLAERAYADKLKSGIEAALGRKVRLAFEFTAEAAGSLAAQERRDRAEEQARTEAAFRQEPFVQDVLSRFGASIRPDSIKPV